MDRRDVHDRPWRSLRELASPPDAARRSSFAGEIPPEARRPLSAIERRAFIQLAGATLAAASAGCAVEAPRKIVPYTRQPSGVAPGVPAFYATSLVLDGYASGILVESREGRPIKIEANPDHPSTLGGTSLFDQAAIRQLYDDHRGRQVRRDGELSSWEDLFATLRSPRADRGAGLRILMEPTGSPLLLALCERVRRRHPEARVAFHAPLASDADLRGASLAFGRPLLAQYDLRNASAILSLDADFLCAMPFSVRYARQWSRRRRMRGATDLPSRLMMVESQLSVTGSMADDRLPLPLARIPSLAFEVAARSSMAGELARALRDGRPSLTPAEARWAEVVAADLRGRPAGTTLVIAGDRQPPVVHALAYALNEALGNDGVTISYCDPVLPLSPQRQGWLETLDQLVADMRAGRVETLLMLETNPVYTAPADLAFRGALARVPNSVSISYYEHETAERCRWYAPAAHALESWGDARAYDGTVSMIQPLIEPLVGARPVTEALAALAGDRAPDGHQLLHDHWTRQGGLDEVAWQRAVQLGCQPGTAFPRERTTYDSAAIARALRDVVAGGGGAEREPMAVASEAPAIDIEIYPSPTVHDGRFANNPWLLEQPTPIGKLTWDNAALFSPATARAHNLQDGAIIDLHAPHATVRAPVLVVPGLADGVAAVWLGYGRRGQEEIAAGVGFDAYPLRTRSSPHIVRGARVTPVSGQRHALALTQEHWSTHDRPIALRASLSDYRRRPDFTAPYRAPVPSMVPDYEQPGKQWAMSIDLSICTGCSSCTVACQAENNLATVGKEGVLKSREMNWLRIDTYFFGAPEAPRVVHQPMMCQHCEKAPCEYVCPVEATVHSPDGLNEMVYNRCVGTRFCSNNCPYKVRRFNWFDWGERVAMNRGLVQLQYNPEVTVRERGVMEKCTYCVQRIRRAGIEARLDGRELRPGEVVTACAAACPTGAIQFGSLTDRDTEMVRWRNQDRAYAVLQREEGTRPRTIYLARIDNPNEALG